MDAAVWYYGDIASDMFASNSKYLGNPKWIECWVSFFILCRLKWKYSTDLNLTNSTELPFVDARDPQKSEGLLNCKHYTTVCIQYHIRAGAAEWITSCYVSMTIEASLLRKKVKDINKPHLVKKGVETFLSAVPSLYFQELLSKNRVKVEAIWA